jgi:FMN-dependent NADH-azoreductase
MKKILVLNANSKNKEYSRTQKITDAFLNEYKSFNPDHKIEEVNLFDAELQDVDQDVMAGFGQLMGGASFTDLPEHIQLKLGKRNEVLEQFKAADKIILSTPMWDLNNPAVVKKWIDNIVVANETFKYTENGPVGLVENKKALFIQTAGGDYTNMPDLNFGYNYFKAIMNFVGINDFNSIHAFGMDSGLEDKNLPVAINQAVELAKSF